MSQANETRFPPWSPRALLKNRAFLTVAIVLLVSLVGLRIGVRLFDREAILTRWR